MKKRVLTFSYALVTTLLASASFVELPPSAQLEALTMPVTDKLVRGG